MIGVMSMGKDVFLGIQHRKSNGTKKKQHYEQVSYLFIISVSDIKGGSETDGV
jgi:hypothetical protein